MVCCIMISYSLDNDSNITEEHTASVFRVTSEDTENKLLQNTSTYPQCQYLPTTPVPTNITSTYPQHQYLPTSPVPTHNTSTYQHHQYLPTTPVPTHIPTDCNLKTDCCQNFKFHTSKIKTITKVPNEPI